MLTFFHKAKVVEDSDDDLPTRRRANGIVAKPAAKKSSGSETDTSASSDDDKDIDDLDAPIDPFGKPSNRNPDNTDLDDLFNEKTVPAFLADEFKPAMEKLKLDQEKATLTAQIKSLADVKGDLSAEQKQRLDELVGKVKELEKSSGSDEDSFVKELDGIIKNGNKQVVESFESSFEAQHLLGAETAVGHGEGSSFLDDAAEDFEKMLKGLH